MTAMLDDLIDRRLPSFERGLTEVVVLPKLTPTARRSGPASASSRSATTTAAC